MRRHIALLALAALSLAACGADTPDDDPTTGAPPAQSPTAATPAQTTPAATPSPDTGPGNAPEGEPVTAFETIEHESFDEPWALEFLPGTDLLAITERAGGLKLRDQATGEITDVSGVPDIFHGGQAGVHDLVVAPSFEQDGAVYLSWVAPHAEGSQGMVGLATLDVDAASLDGLRVIWRQDPGSSRGHYSLRMAIRDDFLYLTSGERQQSRPAQDHGTNLGKVLRLNLDGTPAAANPFGDEGVESSFWSIGHRNPLGIDFDVDGNLWSTEMGPEGGDELNLIKPGANYGWPEASMGRRYNGADIPDHVPGDGFEAPKVYWVPSISPGNLEIYEGDLFTGWRNSALIGGLSGQTLVRVALDGEDAEVVDQWDMGARIREVEEAPDGSIWVARDGSRLLELRPA